MIIEMTKLMELLTARVNRFEEYFFPDLPFKKEDISSWEYYLGSDGLVLAICISGFGSAVVCETLNTNHQKMKKILVKLASNPFFG